MGAFLLLCLSIVFFRFIKAKSLKEYVFSSFIAIILLLPTPIIDSTIFFLAFAILLVISLVFILASHKNKSSISKSVYLLNFQLFYTFLFRSVVPTQAAKLNSRFFSSQFTRHSVKQATQHNGSNISTVTASSNPTIEVSTIGGSLSRQIENYTQNTGTVYVRESLLKSGLDFFKQNPLFGSGPGGFQKLMESSQHHIQQTLRVTSPHNFLIELLVHYGLLIFVPALIVFFYMINMSVKKIRAELKARSPGRGVLALLMLITFAMAGIMPSGYIRLTPVWLFFIAAASTLELNSDFAAESTNYLFRMSRKRLGIFRGLPW